MIFFAVDIDGGRGADGGAGAVGHVAIDGGLGFGSVEKLGEFGHIETEFFGPFEDGLAIDGAVVGIHFVVQGPELALGVGGERSAGGEGGLGVLIERELFVDEADIVGEGLQDGFELRDGLDTEGALEIGEFDDGDFGVDGAFDGGAEDVDGDGIEEDSIALGAGLDEGGSGEFLADLRGGFAGGGGGDD